MNIMVPLSDPEMLDPFCDSGADEFYLGIYDPVWENRFGTFSEMNRMSSFGSRANMELFVLEKTAKKIQARGKKVFVTLNSASYSYDEIRYLECIVEKLSSISIDGLIVGNLSLLTRLRSCGIPITMSTMGGIYNRDIVEFYWKMGIRRIILPRDISSSDLEKIVKLFPEISFEVFIMRNGCKYSDSSCMSFHARKYGSMCSSFDCLANEIHILNFRDPKFAREVYANHTLFSQAFHKSACGLCAIDWLLRIGIQSVKVVGRADDPKALCRDIQRIRSLIDCSKESVNYFSENCLYGLNCYYPYCYDVHLKSTQS